MGKKGRKKDFSTKEKELLEIENLKLQKREKQASIISTIVIMIVSVITAILKWLGLIDYVVPLTVGRQQHRLSTVKSIIKEADLAMKKLRQFLQSVLFINFMVGIYDGMRAKNLVAILINGVVVLALIAGEKEER